MIIDIFLPGFASVSSRSLRLALHASRRCAAAAPGDGGGPWGAGTLPSAYECLSGIPPAPPTDTERRFSFLDTYKEIKRTLGKNTCQYHGLNEWGCLPLYDLRFRTLFSGSQGTKNVAVKLDIRKKFAFFSADLNETWYRYTLNQHIMVEANGNHEIATVRRIYHW